MQPSTSSRRAALPSDPNQAAAKGVTLCRGERHAAGAAGARGELRGIRQIEPSRNVAVYKGEGDEGARMEAVKQAGGLPPQTPLTTAEEWKHDHRSDHEEGRQEGRTRGEKKGNNAAE